MPSCEITSVQIRLFWSLKRNETQDPNNVISLNLRYNWFEKSRWALFINIQRLYSLNLIIGVSGEREIREPMVAGTLGSVKVRVRAGAIVICLITWQLVYSFATITASTS